MIAVLMDSRRKGASCLIAVREAKRLRVSGLDGDIVRVLFFNEDETPCHRTFYADEEVELPRCHSVQAEHSSIGKGRVFVDLLR